MTKPIVLSIAGFDPSAGAGILSDIKTFERNNVYGFGVCTAITIQNDQELKSVQWVEVAQIKEQIKILSDRFHLKWVKIGLVESFEVLEEIVNYLNELENEINIIWDPIIKSTSGFIFHKQSDRIQFEQLCKQMFLVTPNMFEMRRLMPDWGEVEAAKYLSNKCHVLLKGGHDHSYTAKDLLFVEKKMQVFDTERLRELDKHGTGCVLSSTITAQLALGKTIEESCQIGKNYIHAFMKSNKSLLGEHPHEKIS